jgi:hypothetical protein
VSFTAVGTCIVLAGQAGDADYSAAEQVSQSFAISGTAPSITSGASTSFDVLSNGSFTVTATGEPTPALSETGALPNGLTFTDNGDGTATLSGTPTTGTAGSYPVTFTASNGVAPNATQSFTLTVAKLGVDHLHFHRSH